MEYRILVVCQRFWPENQKLTDICEGFIERGMKVDVLCGQPSFPNGKKPEKQDDPEIRNGIRIFRTYETSNDDTGSLAILANYVSFRLSSVAALKKLEKIHYDKIFIYQMSPVTMCAAGLKLGERRGLDVTMFVAELWPHIVMDELDVRSSLFQKFLEGVAKHYYLQADKLVVNSMNTKKYFMKELHIPEERVKYIPQTAEKIYENPTVDHDLLERFAGSFKIVYTGEISRKQSFHGILFVLSKAVKRGMKNLRFIIVGSGPNEEELKEQVSGTGLKDYVVFEGAKKIQEIPSYLSMADVLFDARRPNEAEDFYVPSKLVSYMASGKPLLLSMGGDAKEIVKAADCGFVSDPEDDDALYINLMRLYKMTRAERKVLGVNGKLYQREHFNRDKNIVMLMEEIHATKKINYNKQGKDNKKGNEKNSKETDGFSWIDDEFRE